MIHKCSSFWLSDFMTFPWSIFNTTVETKCCVLLWPDAWCFLKALGAEIKKSYTPLSSPPSPAASLPLLLPILGLGPKLRAMLKEVLVRTQPPTYTLTLSCLLPFLIIIFSVSIFQQHSKQEHVIVIVIVDLKLIFPTTTESFPSSHIFFFCRVPPFPPYLMDFRQLQSTRNEEEGSQRDVMCVENFNKMWKPWTSFQRVYVNACRCMWIIKWISA